MKMKALGLTDEIIKIVYIKTPKYFEKINKQPEQEDNRTSVFAFF